MHGSWTGPGAVRPLRVVPPALLRWAQWEPLIFSPLEPVRPLTVSINTARWGHCLAHPDEGSRLAKGGDMQRGRRGNFRAHVGTRKAGPASHRLPSCLCLGQSPPAGANSSPRRGTWKSQGHRWGSSARLWPLQDPCSCCHPRVRTSELSSQSQPLTHGGFGHQPQLFSNEPNPQMTQSWRVFSPSGGPPKGLILAFPQISS